MAFSPVFLNKESPVSMGAASSLPLISPSSNKHFWSTLLQSRHHSRGSERRNASSRCFASRGASHFCAFVTDSCTVVWFYIPIGVPVSNCWSGE